MAAWREPPNRDYPRTRLRDMRWRDWAPIAVIAIACFLVVALNLHA